MANTFYIDYLNGNDANDGLSFANRKKTIAGVPSASSSPGDEFRVMATPGPHTLNVNATWTNNSNTISLSSNVNILLYDGGTAWTAGTVDVACAANTTGRRDQTLACAQVAIGTAFTTGLAAYYTLPASTDCSAHSGLSFWYYQSIGQANAANLSIRLCSDTVGATPVNTIVIPRINVANSWFPCYVETGSAFGSAIQSIALYVDVDTGPINVFFQNINTVKPNTSNDNLNITSIIGKGSANDGWWPIRSINAATIFIDGGAKMTASGNVLGYSGNTETVALIKHDPVQLANNFQTSATISINSMILNESGNATHLYTITGGWNRTDMSTQTGETFYDAMWGWGTMFGQSNRNYVAFDKIHGVRCYHSLFTTTTGSRFGHMYAVGTQSAGIVATLSDSMANVFVSTASMGQGVILSLLSALTLGQAGGSNANTIISNCAGSGSAPTTTINVDGFINTASVSGMLFSRIGTVIARGGRYIGVHCYYPMRGVVIDTIVSANNGGSGLTYITSYAHHLLVNRYVAQNNRTYGIVVNSDNMGGSRFNYMEVSNNFTAGLWVDVSGQGGPPVVIGELVANQSGTSSCIRCSDMSYGTIYILKSTLTGNALSFTTTNNSIEFPGELTLRNYNGTAGDHRTYYHANIAHVYSSTEQRHTASGYSWKFAPRHTHYIHEYAPLTKKIATVAVGASSLVTVSVWAYRDNINIYGKLIVNGGQIAGVPNDTYVVTSGSASAWEQLSTTFTPTETGVVEVHMQVYGGNTYNLWIDDFSMSQA